MKQLLSKLPFLIIIKWISGMFVIIETLTLAWNSMFPELAILNIKNKFLNSFFIIIPAIWTIYVTLSKLSNKMTLWEEIFSTKYLKRTFIQMDISFSAYSYDSEGINNAPNLLESFIKSLDGKNVKNDRSYEDSAIYFADIDSQTRCMKFSVNKINEDNVYEKNIRINHTVSDYDNISSNIDLIEMAKKFLIDEKGGEIKKTSSFKAQLLFTNNTPFYRFTVKELEHKSNEIQYNMVIPEGKEGCVEITKNQNTDSVMTIKSSKLSFLRNTMKKYFVKNP